MKERLLIAIRGAVQGVGFRPFVYRLATELHLAGWVSNSPQGVCVEAEGEKETLNSFLLRIEKEKPPRSFIQSLEFSFLDPQGYSRFEIRESDQSGEPSALVLPDIATCPECLSEIFDPGNRRYRYPFTNCTNCGPRFSIIESLPYDRPNTTMNNFPMCPDCREEYENPLDRRFHAQPNACPKCGPQLALWSPDGRIVAKHYDALLQVVEALGEGMIVAVKGIGGFHLMVDARNEEAVVRLRQRKHREEKPFALMFPSIESVRMECEVSDLEERLLFSAESPIVILNRKSQIGNCAPKAHQPPAEKSSLANRHSSICPSVAPGNPSLGAMLPYTPLHHLLMRELGFPVVATSGNLSDEPICIDEREALKRLGGIADLFLVHDRPIVRHVDDSVVRVMMGRELVLRRARGYAPLPVSVKSSDESTILAVGAHLKNTIALAKGRNVFISQHIGDLETQESLNAFHDVIKSLKNLYNASPETFVCDMHPDYLSTQFAKVADANAMQVQHHFAHVASCMAENQMEGSLLGVSWDGTGYGPDGTIWGGEFLLVGDSSFERVGTLRHFKLPGGEKAIHEPRRTAMGVLYELYGESLFERVGIPFLKAFDSGELLLLRQMLTKNINSPVTSSAGRLFDAVSSLIGIRDVVKFEGQAAMELEWAIDGVKTEETYRFTIFQPEADAPLAHDCRVPSDRSGDVRCEQAREGRKALLVVDWAPMIVEIIEDLKAKVPNAMVSAKFHNTLTSMIVDVTRRVGEKRIVLTGGCFQNKYLTERTVQQLEENGFKAYWHQRVPPNDGGISLGQVYAAKRMMRAKSKPESILIESLT
jgi:hydrogenase maturation protein HypF